MATVHETYAAALRHDRADLPPETRLVGVVRRPMGWFHAVVDENRPALGPADDLLDELKERQAAFDDGGLDEDAAARQAWEDVRFGDRYDAHLEENPAARAALDDLVDRVRSGTDVALVCYEAAEKPCHRHRLRERLLARLDG